MILNLVFNCLFVISLTPDKLLPPYSITALYIGINAFIGVANILYFSDKSKYFVKIQHYFLLLQQILPFITIYHASQIRCHCDWRRPCRL